MVQEWRFSARFGPNTTGALAPRFGRNTAGALAAGTLRAYFYNRWTQCSIRV